MLKRTSQDDMKIKNYSKILDQIMHNPGINRKKISEMTQLSTQTLTNLVKELMDFGFLEETSVVDTKGQGRRPIGLVLNFKAFLIVSIAMTRDYLTVSLNSCDGEVLWSETHALRLGMPFIPLLKASVEHALEKAPSRAFAIVMSSEGSIDEENKILKFVKALNLVNIEVGKELSYLNIPFFLFNDINLACIYENLMYPKLDNFMTLKLSSGISCAIALDKQIQMTRVGIIPGLLGHLRVLNTEEKITCWCGKENCLSVFMSQDNLEERFGQPYEKVLQEIRDDENATYEQTMISYLAPILSNITTLLGLQKILVTGKMVTILGERFTRSLDFEIAKNVPSWVQFRGIEQVELPSVPILCSQYFMDYFLKHVFEYLELVDESPFQPVDANPAS